MEALASAVSMRNTDCAESSACLGDLPDQREQLGRILHQALARRRHLGVIFEVIVAVGQRQAALVDVGDHVIGTVQVGRRIKTEQRIGPDQLHPGNGFDQRRLVFSIRDALEFRLQRVDSVGVRGGFVDAGTVVVADFLSDGVASRIWPVRLSPESRA